MAKDVKSPVFVPTNTYRKKPLMKPRIIPTLNRDGSEILDPKPLAADLVGLRPLTLEEQYIRFTQHGENDLRLVYDDHLDPDDFEEDVIDDINPPTVHEGTDLQRHLAAAPPAAIKSLTERLRNLKRAPKPKEAPTEASSSDPAQPTPPLQAPPPSV